MGLVLLVSLLRILWNSVLVSIGISMVIGDACSVMGWTGCVETFGSSPRVGLESLGSVGTWFGSWFGGESSSSSLPGAGAGSVGVGVGNAGSAGSYIASAFVPR